MPDSCYCRPRKHKAPVRHTSRSGRYITRHDYEGSRGYQVRIGREASLFFGLHRYGSMRKALAAAKAYRDEVLPLLAQAGWAYQGNLSSSRNTTGHIGVNLVRDEAYVAQWLDASGKRRKRWFAIAKYGREGALTNALRFRAEGVGHYPAELLEQVKEVTERYRAGR